MRMGTVSRQWTRLHNFQLTFEASCPPNLGLGNIMDAMKKAQEFTSVAKDLQEQLRSTVIEASVRGGQVTVTMTAQQVPLQVNVSEELLAKGSEEVRCPFLFTGMRRTSIG